MKSYIAWIHKAKKDIMLAELAFNSKIYDYATFHAQQAVEKALKAFLVYHGRPIRKTHDIALLVEVM